MNKELTDIKNKARFATMIMMMNVVILVLFILLLEINKGTSFYQYLEYGLLFTMVTLIGTLFNSVLQNSRLKAKSFNYYG